MEKDVETIIQFLKQEFPEVQVNQLEVTHPSDDDGLWFISWPNKKGEIQIESPSGMCPFIIESTEFNKPLHGKTVGDVVAKIRAVYSEFFIESEKK